MEVGYDEYDAKYARIERRDESRPPDVRNGGVKC